MPIPPNIPWDQVLRHGPKVLETATALFERWQTRRPEPVDPNAEVRQQLETVVGRLQALEEAEASQAALVRSMAEQLTSQTSALQEANRRARMAVGVAGVAGVVAVVAMAMVLMR